MSREGIDAVSRLGLVMIIDLSFQRQILRNHFAKKLENQHLECGRLIQLPSES